MALWKIEGHRDGEVITATAPDEQSAFGVMAAFGDQGYFPSTFPAGSCDSCDRIVHVDELSHVSACSLHDEATVCDDCLNGGRPRLAVVPA